MSEQYRAIYTDAYGQEQVFIELEPDEFHLSMTLRGVHFHGLAFNLFYVWPIEQNPADLQHFYLREGHPGGGAEQARQSLENYALQWTMPLQIVKAGQLLTGILYGNLDQRDEDLEDSLVSSHYTLNLQIGEDEFEVSGEELDMEEALGRFQQQLPPEMYLKCCRFCMLSYPEPFGGTGTLCFRRRKEPFRTIKYHSSKNKINSLRVGGEVGYVQESYLCPEFEEDRVAIARARQQRQ